MYDQSIQTMFNVILKKSSLRATCRSQTQLETDVDAATKQLAQLREENKERELTMRKAKKKSEQDAELSIGEYDKDLSERDQDCQEELSMLTALEAKLAVRDHPDYLTLIYFTHSVCYLRLNTPP